MLIQPDGPSVDQLSKRKSQESAVVRALRGGGGGVGGVDVGDPMLLPGSASDR